MSPAELAGVLAAGLGAGVLTSTVGVASLLSFPVLVALGLPPVVANASNTVGLLPGAVSGSLGYREELRSQPTLTLRVLVTSAVGAVAGALLLLVLPPAVFEAVVPWLILGTCVLVGLQPRLSRLLRARRSPDLPQVRTEMSRPTTFFAVLTGSYGGYFGAGSGVMMMAVLGLGLDLDLRVVNALKTLSVMAGNLVASAIFLVLADLAWEAVVPLAVGSVLGGYVGARVGRRLPATLLRSLVVVAGVTGAVVLLVTG